MSEVKSKKVKKGAKNNKNKVVPFKKDLRLVSSTANPVDFEQLERDKIKDNNMQYWISIHKIYVKVLECMKKLYSERRLYIVTLKDRKSCSLTDNHIY